MPSEIKNSEPFKALVAALAEYDRTAPFRSAMLDRAQTLADVHHYEEAVRVALEPLQIAYYAAFPINAMEKCRLLNADDVRRIIKSMASDHAPAPVVDVPIESRIGGWSRPGRGA